MSDTWEEELPCGCQWYLTCHICCQLYRCEDVLGHALAEDDEGPSMEYYLDSTGCRLKPSRRIALTDMRQKNASYWEWHEAQMQWREHARGIADDPDTGIEARQRALRGSIMLARVGAMGPYRGWLAGLQETR